jgi:disease resistance protein RPM1
LSLYLGAVDEKDLKILGGLPELRYLDLFMRSSATISNVSDSDAGYFQKLRHCVMDLSTVWFLPNKVGKSLSFHIWDGQDDIFAMPFGPGKNNTNCNTSTAAPAFMPHLQKLSFIVYVRALRDRCYSDNFGLEYLPSLREIEVQILCTAAEVVQVEAALRRAANVHPNRPILVISKFDKGNIIPQQEEEVHS